MNENLNIKNDVKSESKIDSSKVSVIMDTNFLFSMFKFNVDVFDLSLNFPFVIIVFSGTIDELKDISEKTKKAKTRKEAVIIMKIIEKKEKEGKIKIVESEKYVDDAILEYAKNHEVVVATADKELKRKLKNALGFLVVRSKKWIKYIENKSSL